MCIIGGNSIIYHLASILVTCRAVTGSFTAGSDALASVSLTMFILPSGKGDPSTPSPSLSPPRRLLLVADGGDSGGEVLNVVSMVTLEKVESIHIIIRIQQQQQ